MRLVSFLIIILILGACSFKKEQPKILSHTEMGRVLWDIMLVEEYSNLRVTRDSIKNIDQERLHLYQKIFQLHKITREDFSASLKYYASRSDVMKKIVDSLSVKNDRQKKLPLIVP